MKRKTLFTALVLLISGLLSVSCGKADFLEGTVWVGDLKPLNVPVDEGKLYFTSREKFVLVLDNSVFDEGQYSGKGKTVILQLDNYAALLGTITGTIDGDKMKISLLVADDVDLTFKKQK